MPDTQERPLDELLFGRTFAPPNASLAELLTAWYRAEAAQLADGATCQRTDRARPDTDDGQPG
jgi:hypothetical protein